MFTARRKPMCVGMPATLAPGGVDRPAARVLDCAMPPTTEYDGLLVEQRGAALWLTLDQPETFNALTGDMVLGMVEQLRAAVSREDVRVVVVTGTGAAFSAGADLSGDAPQERYDAAAVAAANVLIRAITDCDKPVVCGLNGVAAGVGTSAALACDLVVAK